MTLKLGTSHDAFAGNSRRRPSFASRATHILLLATASVAAVATMQTAAQASSHGEAPRIKGMPRLDASDFFIFRSYEPGRSANVTMIADYVPLQDSYGGPNFFQMDHNGYYDINIDNRGTGRPAMTFRFRFTEFDRNTALTVGGKRVAIPLINSGPISREDNSAQNVIESYTVSLVTYSNGVASETLLKTSSGQSSLPKPVDLIGDKSVPNYGDYSSTFTRVLQIPGQGCGASRVFVGQRKDPFVVNLAETFDLVNYRNPIGDQFANSAMDDLAQKNVTSIILEVPATCITAGGDPVVGAWTTSSMATTNADGSRGFSQVSRLANPLVNELVIGLKDKDSFNSSLPANDGQFLTYVTNPTVPALIQALFPSTTAPTKFPRADLVAVFLTGVAGLNQPKNVPAGSEEMRLNTSIPITPPTSQKRLGVIAGDNAGYPNGRRPGDDVVDITLRVAMGKLYSLGLYGTPSDAPSGNLQFTDGALTNYTFFQQVFPYLLPPVSGSHQPVHKTPVSSAN